jgi:hypothetical protein
VVVIVVIVVTVVTVVTADVGRMRGTHRPGLISRFWR